MNARHRGMVAALGLGTIGVLAIGATKDWIGISAAPNNIWSNGNHWSPTGVPAAGDVVRHLANSNGNPLIRKDADAPDGVLASYEGQLGNSNRRLTIDPFEPLRASGNVVRTGNANTSYTIEIADSADLVVGADLYGFTLDLRGINVATADVDVAGKMGYGPLVVGGGFTGLVDTRTNGGLTGTIDCTYAGASSITDPVTGSPWIIGDGSSDTSELRVDSPNIENVGHLEFMDSASFGGSSLVYTNNFDMFNDDGLLVLHKVNMYVDNTIYIAGAPDPMMNFDGSSRLRYGLNANSVIYFSSATDDMATLRFADAASLMQPTDYPEAPGDADGISLQLHLQVGSDAMQVDVGTLVARDGLAFDAALVDLYTRATPLIAEAFTPDVCNVQFMDHLVPDSTNPVIATSN